MKKNLILLFALVLVLSFAGCGIKGKIQDKVGEAIGEKVIEGVGDGKVDIDGDKITIEGDDGTEVTFGGTEWPKSDMAKNIPKFKNGNVISVVESQEAVQINLEEVSKKDFESYLNQIKKEYTENAFETTSEELISYGADNGKGVGIMLYYGDEAVSITITTVENQ
jgi:uncharacterized lipoprotein YehR (DUF1307 family)